MDILGKKSYDFKGKSPLENHHCAVTFDILSRPECDILKGMTQQQQDIFKNDLALLILATDMTRCRKSHKIEWNEGTIRQAKHFENQSCVAVFSTCVFKIIFVFDSK